MKTMRRWYEKCSCLIKQRKWLFIFLVFVLLIAVVTPLLLLAINKADWTDSFLSCCPFVTLAFVFLTWCSNIITLPESYVVLAYLIMFYLIWIVEVLSMILLSHDKKVGGWVARSLLLLDIVCNLLLSNYVALIINVVLIVLSVKNDSTPKLQDVPKKI
jgi:hypothetical protein